MLIYFDKCLFSYRNYFSFSLGLLQVLQGYPQRMRLQRRLYGIYLFRFLAFRVPCRSKLACFCALSFCTPSKYTFTCRNQKSSFKLSYFYSFGSSLQSHPLWETLYKFNMYSLFLRSTYSMFHISLYSVLIYVFYVYLCILCYIFMCISVFYVDLCILCLSLYSMFISLFYVYLCILCLSVYSLLISVLYVLSLYSMFYLCILC